jgi:hypothetical protein
MTNRMLANAVTLALLILIAFLSEVSAQELSFAAKQMKEAAGDNELRKLLKARYNEKLAETMHVIERQRAGVIVGYEVADVARELMRAGLDAHERPEDKVGFLKQILELTEDLKTILEKREPAALPPHHLPRIRAIVLEVRIEMLKLKTDAPKAK